MTDLHVGLVFPGKGQPLHQLLQLLICLCKLLLHLSLDLQPGWAVLLCQQVFSTVAQAAGPLNEVKESNASSNSAEEAHRNAQNAHEHSDSCHKHMS